MKKIILIACYLLLPFVCLQSEEMYEWNIDHDPAKWHIGHRANNQEACITEYYKEGEGPNSWNEMTTTHVLYNYPDTEQKFVDNMKDYLRKNSMKFNTKKLNTRPQSILLEFLTDGKINGKTENVWSKAQKRGKNLYVLMYSTKDMSSVSEIRKNREQFFTKAILVPARADESKVYPFFDAQLTFSTTLPGNWTVMGMEGKIEKERTYIFAAPHNLCSMMVAPAAKKNLDTWKESMVEKGGLLNEEGKITLGDGSEVSYSIYGPMVVPNIGKSNFFITSVKNGEQEKIIVGNAPVDGFDKNLSIFKEIVSNFKFVKS